MKLSDAVTDFLRYLQHEQGATKQTCICYRSYLTSLLDWYQENGYPDAALSDFNTPTLRRYLYHHAERGLRPRTLRGRFHPIKALAVFLVNNGAIKENPTNALTLPKLDAAERMTVSDGEVAALLEDCDEERLRDVAHLAALNPSLPVPQVQRSSVDNANRQPQEQARSRRFARR